MKILAALAATLVVAAFAATAGAVTAPPVATALAALGDSITRAFDTCSVAYTDCPANSWSTGSNAAVNSWGARLKARTSPALVAYNDAKTGAKMVDLPGQAATAVTQGADVVTVMMGSNDVCTSSLATMTPAATVGQQLSQALATLTATSPTRQIYVASIPDVYHLWSIFHANLAADFVWGIAGICQSLLANPRSTATADVARRNAVAAQVNADDAAIATACAAVPQCHYDNGAAHAVQFSAANVTTRDYFHPSVSGQAIAANAEWTAFFAP
ncbi:MAG TPA: GDSL-type esterase/lipase family protein [Gaiellaceae bacterium]|jgi:lysophospholipase L1-like esterase